MPLTGSQWIHIAALCLGALVIIAGIYNQMQLASALGVLVTLAGAIGAYVGGSSAKAAPPGGN